MLFGRNRDAPAPGLDWERDGPWRDHSTCARRETIEWDERTYLCRVRPSHDDTWRIAYGTPTGDGRSRGFLFHDGSLEWTTPLDYPVTGLVADDGTVVILEGGTADGLDGTLRAFDSAGTAILTTTFDANVSDCDLSTDGRIAAVRTNPPDERTYLFDLQDGEIRSTHATDWAAPSYVRLYSSDSAWYAYLSRSLERKPLYAVDPDGEIVWENSTYRKLKPLSTRIASRLPSR
ncbi:PQQ-binding-like beta-propeller repeat protein [Halopiger djelfimassiliensis]|uniref:PQQ-binding-like beta-propeller repeat protein n=1 Tax=Halopiger djelfimassiliensis TaxID=1293047 RepID=UPI0006778F40|nr:PQQ-binding-like beta-propeller repeat protein [Halopiger djelfimassiliensis]